MPNKKAPRLHRLLLCPARHLDGDARHDRHHGSLAAAEPAAALRLRPRPHPHLRTYRQLHWRAPLQRQQPAISIFADGLRIFVASDETGVHVRIVDMMGRVLVDQPLHAYAAYPVPAAGIYLVKVGDRPAKKISVVK